MELASNTALAPIEPEQMSCPLCQAAFDPSCANCSSACPMAKDCSVLTCPSCGYSFPKPTGLSAWLARFFAGRRAAALERIERRTLSQASAGQRVRVTGVLAEGADRLSKLAAFGIVEGSELFVRQRRPTLIVQIGETTLALDAEVASAILVASAD